MTGGPKALRDPYSLYFIGCPSPSLKGERGWEILSLKEKRTEKILKMGVLLKKWYLFYRGGWPKLKSVFMTKYLSKLSVFNVVDHSIVYSTLTKTF